MIGRWDRKTGMKPLRKRSAGTVTGTWPSPTWPGSTYPQDAHNDDDISSEECFVTEAGKVVLELDEPDGPEEEG